MGRVDRPWRDRVARPPDPEGGIGAVRLRNGRRLEPETDALLTPNDLACSWAADERAAAALEPAWGEGRSARSGRYDGRKQEVDR